MRNLPTETFLISPRHVGVLGQPESHGTILCRPRHVPWGAKCSQGSHCLANLKVSFGSSEKGGGWQGIQREPRSRQGGTAQSGARGRLRGQTAWGPPVERGLKALLLPSQSSSCFFNKDPAF